MKRSEFQIETEDAYFDSMEQAVVVILDLAQLQEVQACCRHTNETTCQSILNIIYYYYICHTDEFW